jgi:hypothetical protein
MMRTLSWRLSILLTVLVLLLASSCSSGSDSLAARSDSGGPLVLVLYGDSMLTWPLPNRGAIDGYIEMLEEDFGVHVNMHLPSMGPYGSPPVIAEYLPSDRAKSELAGADVVIIESPISGLGGSVVTVAGFEGLDPADCGGDDNQQCLRDSLAGYKDGVEEIFSLLTEAVDPSETLIRAVDGYAILVEDQLAADTLRITNPYWQEAQEFFAETAATRGIPTAQVFAEFNGPDGTHQNRVRVPRPQPIIALTLRTLGSHPPQLTGRN